jgi:hypothetical protein
MVNNNHKRVYKGLWIVGDNYKRYSNNVDDRTSS